LVEDEVVVFWAHISLDAINLVFIPHAI